MNAFQLALQQELRERRQLHRLLALLVILSLWQSLHLIMASF